jgi:hypothetical protein
VLEHPFFTYCTIDAYRVEYQYEETAWARFFEDIAHSRETVVETTGLDWRLGTHLPRHRKDLSHTDIDTETK